MKNEIDSKFILNVFEKIRQHGEPKEQGHSLEGVTAFSDFDGYTVFIEDANVKLRFGFHNQYHFDYEKEEHLTQFEHKLKTIDKNY